MVSIKDYDVYCSGSVVDVFLLQFISNLLVLMGGGFDVDDVFCMMIVKVCGGLVVKVDIVVLCIFGVDGYNFYLMVMDGVDLVEFIVLKMFVGVSVFEVLDMVNCVDVFFIVGGDQFIYIV